MQFVLSLNKGKETQLIINSALNSIRMIIMVANKMVTEIADVVNPIYCTFLIGYNAVAASN